MDHSNVIYLLDPEGHPAANFPRPLSPEDLAKDVRAKI
jgi:cytochrome oxidase Cu insertion factor (SCO1/SenC/PrrC family)